RGLLCFSNTCSDIRFIRIHETADHGCLRDQYVQCFKLLCYYTAKQGTYACGVTARSIDAGNETELNWIAGDCKKDRNGVGGRLGGKSGGRPPDGDEQSQLAANQFRCKPWQSIVLVVGPAELAFCVATVGVTSFVQGPPKGAEPPSVGLRRPTAKKSDNGRCRQLGARRERPRDRSATNYFDEIAPSHGRPADRASYQSIAVLRKGSA